ncbi:hypothetical protein Hanom_Chr15g01391331 [Helianthus anomalus]
MFVPNFRRCSLPLKLMSFVLNVSKSCMLSPLRQIQLIFFVKTGHLRVFLSFSYIFNIIIKKYYYYYYYYLYMREYIYHRLYLFSLQLTIALCFYLYLYLYHHINHRLSRRPPLQPPSPPATPATTNTIHHPTLSLYLYPTTTGATSPHLPPPLLTPPSN